MLRHQPCLLMSRYGLKQPCFIEETVLSCILKCQGQVSLICQLQINVKLETFMFLIFFFQFFKQFTFSSWTSTFFRTQKPIDENFRKNINQLHIFQCDVDWVKQQYTCFKSWRDKINEIIISILTSIFLLYL